jgi:DNA topoisomerase-1
LEENGIGRPSTYAPTIYVLLDRSYVERKGGALVPTELGEVVVDLLVQHFPKIMDFEFTALMEEELDKIEEGELEWHRVLEDFHGPFSQYLEQARVEMRNVRREAVPTDEVCDVCGKQMVIRWGRFGQFLACSGFPECRYTKSLPTGFRCQEPGCNGDLVKRQSKKGQRFYGCSNYPKCTYITRKLPKDLEKPLPEEEKPPKADLEEEGIE